MIDKKLMAEVVRHLDSLADGRVPVPDICFTAGIEAEDVRHVAVQRALRAIMAGRGQAIPNVTQTVSLNREELRLEARLAGLWIDAFVAGVLAERTRAQHSAEREK